MEVLQLSECARSCHLERKRHSKSPSAHGAFTGDTVTLLAGPFWPFGVIRRARPLVTTPCLVPRCGALPCRLENGDHFAVKPALISEEVLI